MITANEIHIICGGKCRQSTNNIKMRQAIMNKNQTMPSGQKPVFHKSPEKRGLSDLENLIQSG